MKRPVLMWVVATLGGALIAGLVCSTFGPLAACTYLGACIGSVQWLAAQR